MKEKKKASDQDQLISKTPAALIPVDFEHAARIEGVETQLIVIDLQPNQRVRAEPGSVIYMTESVEMETSIGESWYDGIKRWLTGESFFVCDFTVKGSKNGTIAFGTPFPAKILRIQLSDFGGSIICKRGAFLCGCSSTKIEMEFAKRLATGLFAGDGFILQRLNGQGDVFVSACGALIETSLKEGEVLRIGCGCLVAFSTSVHYDVKPMNIKNALFGGQGIFMTTLTGPGKVFLQGLPFQTMAREIANSIGYNQESCK